MEQQGICEYDVFISYARKDYVDDNKNIIPNNPITRLTDAFEKNGISYWIDEKGIYSGDRFAKLIANSIKKSSVFLFISSENSNASDWTVGEIAVAREYKKKMIPFRIDTSAYNENVIVYLAPLDYASYVDAPEKSIKKVVDSINEYKEYLIKQKEENELRVAAEKNKQQEKEKIEWEIKQKEIQRKEQERLAAITEERKKKEEELKAIYNQLRDLDAEASERKEKKIQLENEIRTIDNKLSFIDKQREQLEARRKYHEKHLSVYVQDDLMPQNENKGERKQKELVKDDPKNRDHKSKWIVLVEKKWYFFAVVALCVIAVLGVLYMNRNVQNGSVKDFVSDSLVVDIDSVSGESVLELVPVETDEVYGIDAMARISNWDDLRVSIPDKPNRLHKISFAFIKVLHGISNYVPESKRNREDASKSGIRVAMYHVLNIIPDERNVTGKAQALRYHDYVGDLKSSELPPVLVIPSPDKDLNPNLKKKYIMCAKERAQQWIDEIISLYNVTPIVYVSSKEYKDFYHGNLHNCRYWLTNNKEAQFAKMFIWDKAAKYYNGTELNEGYTNKIEINVFNGSFQDFINFK